MLQSETSDTIKADSTTWKKGYLFNVWKKEAIIYKRDKSKTEENQEVIENGIL